MNTFLTGLALLCLCGLVSAVAFCLVPTQTEPVQFQRGDNVKLNGQIQGYLAVEGSFTKPVTIKPFHELIFKSETLNRYYFTVVFNETKPTFKSGDMVSLSKDNFHALKYRIINQKYKQPN